jgi:hypothetical protein
MEQFQNPVGILNVILIHIQLLLIKFYFQHQVKFQIHVEDVHQECVLNKNILNNFVFLSDLYKKDFLFKFLDEDFNVIKLPLLDDEVRDATNINSFSQHLIKQYKS